MTKIDPRGKTALITGASSGLGIDFARELARCGANVILVARRETELHEVADAISTETGVTATPLVQDLGTTDAARQLHTRIKADGQQVDLLINNAGFGVFGDFLEMDWEREQAMLQLDMVTLVHMSKLFGRDMAERGFGAMLQIASTAAYQPTPGYASYGAAKAFVRSFSYAINQEMRARGVTSTVLSPGVTATAFLQVSGQRKTLFQKITMMQPAQVAQIGVDAMLSRRGSAIAGWMNGLAAHSNRMTPTAISTAVAERLMRN